ncbi:MAG: hypothetical protein H0T89_31880 [Deltaproteobacteria bacterium]|nr:hypothetical protein [Deltaproteobacteria bacterium]MDQ3295885.1 hypothetical protein [Myxococcota bacterium]
MRRISSLFLVATLALGASFTSVAFAKTEKKAPAKTKAKATAKKPKAPPPKKLVAPPTAEKKKELAKLFNDFKFGQDKDEVIKILGKQVEDTYEERIKATTDMSTQDRLRAERKKELARIRASFTSFEGKRTGWDVSIIEEEFAHNTGEAMLERWENQNGKNQRRFFFFHEGKLYKMFVSLDVSILPEDKQNFETFKSVMQSSYGPGNVEPDRIIWKTPEFEVRAVDKLKAYGTLALVIENPKVTKELVAIREAKAPPKKETSAVIKAVLDTDQTDKPDVKANSGTIDAVIKAQGGTK